ncbi:MAG TPA: ABC transporter permease, partial [Chthoniobacterales bacterium]|nr:ABC transporter permease [Chthoniobacterales bacterium]
MTAPLYIALRFATHRKRALLLSLLGVVFGVGIFVCTQAQTQGFAQYFIESSVGSNGALVLRARIRPRSQALAVAAKTTSTKVAQGDLFEGVTNAQEIMRISRQFSNVVSCCPVLHGTVSVRAGFENATADLFGIDPSLHLQTTDLAKQIVDGKFDDFRNNSSSLIIGNRLAEALNVQPNDTVQLLAPSG